MSLTRLDFPEPETPVTATKQPEREADRHVTQVVLARVVNGQLPVRVGGAPDVRDRNRTPARQVGAGERLLAVEQLLHRPADDDLAAVLAGARADVDGPVGRADGVLVVLDDDQRVTEIAQPDERLDEAAIVTLVQPDRRLVQHVEHADQA